MTAPQDPPPHQAAFGTPDFHSIVELAAAGLLVVQDGRIAFLNAKAAELLGRKRDALLGTATAALFGDAADLARHRDSLARLLAKPGLSIAHDYRIARPDGSVVHLSVVSRSAAMGGRPAVVTVLHDVSATRRLNDSLSAAESRMGTLMAALADGVFVAQDHRFVFANPALPTMLGYTREEFVGLPFERVLAPEHLDLWVERFDRRVGGGAEPPRAYEINFLHRDGKPVALELVANRTEHDGRPAVLGVLRDIRERKRVAAELAEHREHLEELVERRTAELIEARDRAEAGARAKSVFLANMSHEIRTPMNAIIGLTHLMRRDQPDPVQGERLDKVTDAAQHLLGIINDVLDLSKIESGKLELESIDFSVDTLLSRACALVAGTARSKGLELVIDDGDLPNMLRGDPTRLSQAIVNLLSNAVKFTERGSVTLHGRTLERDTRGARLRFEVRDTGIGVAPERIDQLFSAFEQADSSTTRRFGGSGLGLAITRHLSQLMGGEAGVTSEAGQGSTFWFTVRMPLAAGGPSEARETALAGLHALVVDDLPEARAAFAGMLTQFGLRVQTAASGREALSLLHAAVAVHDPFAVAIVDVFMPGMDGLETVRHLLAESHEAEAPACILVSAAVDARIREEADELGVARVLEKPVSMSGLHDTLMAVLAETRVDSRPTPLDMHAEQSLRERHLGARVLLAEDNPVNQEVATHLLQLAGLDVDTAFDGQEAVEMARAGRYDLILMDMQMPVMDGLAASRAIRALPELRDTPIIAMTANAFGEDRTACLEAGMNDHVAKPVDPTLLYDTLQRWLATVPRGAARSVPDRSPLPAVTGLDAERGLRFFAGQRESFMRALRQYTALYEDGLPHIDAFLARRAVGRESMRNELHSMGGASAAIGAVDVAARAAALDAMLQAAEPDARYAQAVAMLRADLASLVQSLRSQLPAH